MPSKTKRKPLAEFAKGSRKIVHGNWIESIPEWPEVLAAHKAGVSQTTIRRWLLDECGYPADECTTARVNWLSKGHPRRPRG